MPEDNSKTPSDETRSLDEVAKAKLGQRTSSPMPSTPARRVGGYEILGEIGRGGQGEVFKAKDLRLGRTVALKVLHAEWALSSDTLQRFRREAELTAQLDHPGICTVYESGEDPAGYFIAMRFVEGDTFGKKLRTAKESFHQESTSTVVDAPVTPGPGAVPRDQRGSSHPKPPDLTYPLGGMRETVAFVELMARALHTAHEAGIIHRDIKPGNVMVTASGDPVILDFGLARQEVSDGPSLTQGALFMGTLAYASPEQLNLQMFRVDRRTDIYALGVTLYEGLCLRRPFEEPTDQRLYQAILTKAPTDIRTFNPAVPTDLRIIVETAIDKDRNRRYATAKDLADDLKRWLDHEPILARPAGPVIKFRRWIERNPVVATMTMGLIVVLAVASMVFYLKNAQLNRTNKDLATKTAEAKANAARAENESTAKGVALAEKTKAVEDYDRLADSTLFAQAKNEADQLFPVSPELVSKIESWQGRYAALFLRLESHESTLTKLRESARPYTDADRAKDYPLEWAKVLASDAAAKEARSKAKASNSDDALDAAEDAEDAAKAARKSYLELPRRSADFGGDTKTQFQHDVLAKLVEEMKAFSDPTTGDLADVEARLVRSREIRKKTIDDHAKAWAAAMTRIATNPKYGGLKLTEQVGLIPLGADKDSTLEEFYETETGEAPHRDAQGKIIVTEKMAMVFVLIPGGTFWMGAQNADKTKPNYDPGVYNNEGPVHEVALSAYFLSKYEMTQGQWVRTSKGDRPNPSNWVKARYGQYDFGKNFDLRNPVEQVSWDDSRERLRRLGYFLPTEAQWEYACRAGTQTPWWSGEDAKSLEKCANVADRSRKGVISGENDETIDDQYPATSPVGAFLANRFGLHDMPGNVFEWCEDAYGAYSAAAHRGGDGLRELSGAPNRVNRGGSCDYMPQSARSAYRTRADPAARGNLLGLRASRRIATP